MKLLNKFYADFQVKAEVKEYLIDYLKQMAVKKAFAGEDTSGIKEARQCIESAFRDLDNLYGEKKSKKVTSNK